MVRESVKNYLALATGLTDLTRERAIAAAEALVQQGEAAKDQVTALAEELLVSSKSNREAIAAIVRTEVDRTVTRLGVAKTDDVSALFRGVETALRETAARAADAVHEIAVGMGLAEQQPPPPSAPDSGSAGSVTAAAAAAGGGVAAGAAAKKAAKKATPPAPQAKATKSAAAKAAAPAKSAAKATKATKAAKSAGGSAAAKVGRASKPARPSK